MLNRNSDDIWQSDIDFGFPSAEQYKEDIDIKVLDKLCITEVINADLSIATYGKQVYQLGCTDVLNRVREVLHLHGLDQTIFLYTYGYKNFILAANKNIGSQEFLSLMHMFYKEFEHSMSSHVEVSGVSRFVVVLDKEHMLERALSTLSVNRDGQENFLVSDQSPLTTKELDEEMAVFELLGKAIKEGLVVPYYQGIRNNKTQEIDKYEALIRIVDVDGSVYMPNQFLDIAKKYKLYNRLSQVMLKRALDEFRNRTESLSLNISLHDIRNPSFKKWFLEYVGNYPEPNRVIVEFLETEDYKEENELFDFMMAARDIGCKISVDDFGTGYATYTAITTLRPDYIKVDGQIIKDIVDREENLIILQSICFMTNLIKAKVVAEFVENEEIQNVLLNECVAYSQGYHFSKPRPIAFLPQ